MVHGTNELNDKDEIQILTFSTYILFFYIATDKLLLIHILQMT